MAIPVLVVLVVIGSFVGIDAGQIPAPDREHAEGGPPWAESVAELERFLEEAEVIEQHKLGRGITNPVKVTLERDGVVRHAVFKNVDGQFDSWRSEVAAYEMDKLLGLNMVPPTVERRLRGSRGCLQLWVDGVTMEELTARPPDLEAWRRQVSLMWLFDDLIGNIDRHINNTIVTDGFHLVLIDNSKTFHDIRDLVNDLNRSKASGTRARYWMVPFDEDREEYETHYPTDLIERLRSLTDKQVKAAVGRQLRSHERDLILNRRDLILERLEEFDGSTAR